MEIIPNLTKDNITKPDIEQVEDEKQEYKLIGTFIRTPGLKLFSYNFTTDELIQVVEIFKKTVKIDLVEDKLKKTTISPRKATVDTRNEFFEALNYKNALKRLNKYKAGKIKQLSNMRISNPDSIKLY